MSLPARIASKIDERDGCWEWNAYRDRLGYGMVGWEGKVRVAHRVVYTVLVGPIPKGLVLDHLCRNRGCVNPAHLEPVTHAENMRRGDRYAYGSSMRNRTHCRQGHSLDGRRGDGYRYCKTCARERMCVRRARAAA